MSEAISQLEKVAQHYSAGTNIHEDLPTAGHYWGERYVTEKLRALIGADHAQGMYTKFIRELRSAKDRVQVLTLGCGECNEEIGTCLELLAAGHDNVSFRCIDVATGALERASARAAALGVADRFTFKAGVFDKGDECGIDVVIVSQALHHFTNLEEIFDGIARAIGDHGIFLTNDMIGRNGHMLWPEALVVMDLLWQQLPDRYKHNHCLRRFERQFGNWDNSREANEGIRAQDILPLLIERFGFEFFFAAGNLGMTLFSRHFGSNFDPAIPEDRALIDRIGRLDYDLIDIGYLKPVLMFACMSNRPDRTSLYYRHWTPEFCVRRDNPLERYCRDAKFGIGEPLVFQERTEASECLASGWSSPESGGVWSNAPVSMIRIPLASPRPAGKFCVVIGGMRFAQHGVEAGASLILVDGREIGTISFGPQDAGVPTAASLIFEAKLGDAVEVEFRHERCIVPAEHGLGEERRMLAIRLVHLTLNTVS